MRIRDGSTNLKNHSAGLEDEPGRQDKGEFLITVKGRRTDVLSDGYQVKPEKR